MMMITAKVSRKRTALAVLCALAAVFAVLLLARRGTEPKHGPPPALESNEDRVAYLLDLGWEVETEPVESLRFQLPETLEEPYLSYNALQIPQGFDLAARCGETVERYTYTVTNYPGRPEGVQANLYVCEGVPVAGDILCPGAGGFQEALVRD